MCSMSECLKTQYTILVLVALVNVLRSCPSVCVCKWKNGKQSVVCTNKNLLAIPEGMEPSTQVLEFTGNNLTLLSNEKFLKMELTNLQKIYLSRCRIATIDDHAFKGLTNLVELDLSRNLLGSVPTEIFTDCRSLMKLTLSLNPIRLLRKKGFSHLNYLNTLELNDCEISSIEEDAFQGLNTLEWLNLAGNKLKTMPKKTLPGLLRGIELESNHWECDCHILDLYNWLLDSKIPTATEPLCKGPTRLSGRAIKSIPSAELACLPDVSPTTFYLEIAEGKNLSLLCHVRAIPEARVSWWFQGRVLQNDSMVAPGVHLVYYIEEGTDEKKSELFIYNTNSDDNGTFFCNAENAAGVAQSNFTIRIVVKEEPIVIIVSFPFEYLLAVVVGACALAFLVIFLVIILIARCRRNRNRELKREKTKEVALQYQQNVTKRPVLRESMEVVDSLKDNAEQDVFAPNEELLLGMSPIVGNHVRSPTSLRRYQLEQNPDLINDTESVGRRRDGDGEDKCPSAYRELDQINPIYPISCMKGSREFYKLSDVHLNPSCLLDTDGYPVDFGLPRMHNSAQSDGFYRTLPYNRANKRQSPRYSREAEFLSHSSQPPAYEHYCQGVRYTADGYPVKSSDQLPSPPEGYKAELGAPNSLPCCSALQWPRCVPANLHVAQFATKRCVGAQTDGKGDKNKTENNVRNDPINEVLTESPDEGYEGEPSVV